jgi:hypothetical protein
MAAPLNTCTTIEQRGVVRFLRAKNMDAAKDIHKEMLPIRAAFICDSFPHLIQKRRSQLGFVTYLLNYPRTLFQTCGYISPYFHLF